MVSFAPYLKLPRRWYVQNNKCMQMSRSTRYASETAVAAGVMDFKI